MTIYNENNVPILYRGPGAVLGLSEEVHGELQERGEAATQALQEAAAAVQVAIDAAGADPTDETHKALADARATQSAVHEEHLLTGHTVLLDNTDPNFADYSAFTIGGSNVEEAVTEVIGGFDTAHVGPDGEPSDHIYKPNWVASTDPDLARALADYYSCDVRDIAEVLS